MNSRTLARSGGGRVESCPDSPPPRCDVDPEWGCWDCGSGGSRVTETGRDSDGVRVRRRQCVECGGIWATEERRIHRGAYHSRAENIVESERRRKHRSRIRNCRLCATPYRHGAYRDHRSEPQHVAAEHRRHAAALEKAKRYRAEWMRTKRALQRLRQERLGEAMEPSSNGVLRDELRGVA